MDLTEEQLSAILGMQDFGTRERELQHQMAMANELRGAAAPTKRMDVASQLARGISGAYGGYQQGQTLKAQQTLGADRANFIRELLRKRLGGGGVAGSGNPLNLADYGPALG